MERITEIALQKYVESMKDDRGLDDAVRETFMEDIRNC